MFLLYRLYFYILKTSFHTFRNSIVYQQTIVFISLGILLGEGDAVRRMSNWLTRYRHTDLLLEGLLAKVIADPRITWWQVEAENFESIHNHNAYALVEKHT